MMRSLVDASLRGRKVVLVVALAILGACVWQLPGAKLEALPEFGPPLVQVRTEALGLSAVEVEQLITVPMEQDLLNGVAFLKHIHSESVPGLSAIDLYFEPGTDVLTARQVVQERMAEAHALPNVSQPPQMLQPVSSTSRVMMIGLSSTTLSPIDIGVLARWTLRPKLIGVPGVANVAIWGQRERQLQVQVDPARLAAADVTLEQVVDTTGNALLVSPLTFLEASTPGTGGFIDTPNQRLGVQHISPIQTADQLAQVVLEDAKGNLRLGDVTRVVEDHQPLIGDARLATGNGFLLVVEKFADASTLEVTRGLESALEAMAPGLTGLDIDTTVYRPATYVETAIGNLRTAGLFGVALALVIALALVMRWRRAAIALIAVSLSMLAAALVLHLMGTTLHALVLVGLLVGLLCVIDDVVTATDGVAASARRRAEEDASRHAHTTVRRRVLAQGRTRTYGAAIALLALVPLFLSGGLAGGPFLPPVATAALAAIAASFLVSLTVTPALAAILGGDRDGSRGPALPLLRRATEVHQRILGPLARRTLPTIGVTTLALLALGAIALPATLGRSLLPSLRDDSVVVQWDTAPGTSLTETNRLGARVTEELRTVDGVSNVGAHFGRAVTADQVVGANGGMLWVQIEPGADYDRTIEAIEDVLQGYPGVQQALLTYSTERIRQVTSGTQDPVVVRIYGDDLSVLRDKAQEVRRLLSKVEGVTPAEITPPAEEPTIQIEVDLDKARAAGVKPGDVRRAATTLLSGIHVGSLFTEQKVFDVQVWGTPEVRRNISDVQNLRIDTPTRQVRLGDVAAVTIAASPNTITHDGVSRRVDVVASVEGRSVDSALAEVRDRMAGVTFPLEYHAEVLGDYEARDAATRLLLMIGAFAAIGILLLLQAAFSSWWRAGLVFASLPVSMLGGSVVASLVGGLNIATGAGLLALLLWAARCGLSLVSRAQQLEAEPTSINATRPAITAAGERVGPVLATAIATASVLVPLLVMGRRPGLEMVWPMAAVILGGLVTTAFTTLFLVPIAYGAGVPASAPHEAAAPPELSGAGRPA